MSLLRKISNRTKRRSLRVRDTIGRGHKARVSVFRSLNHIYAQVIDDLQHKTVASCSSAELTTVKGDKKALAQAVGRELAQRALSSGVTTAVFDRGSYLYHGRVKALADGLREGGLQI